MAELCRQWNRADSGIVPTVESCRRLVNGTSCRHVYTNHLWNHVFFLLLFYLFMFLFVSLSVIYGSELKMKFHCHMMRSTVSKKENVNLDLCLKLNIILTFLTYISKKMMEVYPLFLRIPNLDQKKGKLFKKRKSSFNNLRDSWHLICVERHFE